MREQVYPFDYRIEIGAPRIAARLRQIMKKQIEKGSVVITDGWAAYPRACERIFRHVRSIGF